MPKKQTTSGGNSTMHPETERSRGRCGTCGGHGLWTTFGQPAGAPPRRVTCPDCGA